MNAIGHGRVPSAKSIERSRLRSFEYLDNTRDKLQPSYSFIGVDWTSFDLLSRRNQLLHL